MPLRDVGWVWEGQGLDPGVAPSIFGGPPSLPSAEASGSYEGHPSPDKSQTTAVPRKVACHPKLLGASSKRQGQRVVGERARYLGLTRACFMFHPNSELALEKMRGLDEVVCDITKWEFREVEDGTGRIAFQNFVSGDPALTLAAAEKVSRLARYVERGAIEGFSLLGACLIDTQPEQAAWVREFIAAH